jgi:hypothetical protein
MTSFGQLEGMVHLFSIHQDASCLRFTVRKHNPTMNIVRGPVQLKKWRPTSGYNAHVSER